MSRPDEEAIALLKKLIATPSTSRDESATAGIIRQWLADNEHTPARIDNNIYALAAPLRPELPTVMLNSHHDTVKPSPAYTRDPYMPEEADGRIYGPHSIWPIPHPCRSTFSWLSQPRRRSGANTACAHCCRIWLKKG